jgi:hypothetical protein
LQGQATAYPWILELLEKLKRQSKYKKGGAEASVFIFWFQNHVLDYVIHEV